MTLEFLLSLHATQEARRLLNLLADPHPGLLTWNEACSETAKRILAESPSSELAAMLKNGGAP